MINHYARWGVVALIGVLPLLYWPGFLAAGSTPKWLAASVLLPMLAIYAPRPAAWRAGLLFLLWCAATSLWALSTPMALDRLWLFCLVGLAFISAGALTRYQYRVGMGIALAGIGLNGALILGRLGGVDVLDVVFDHKLLHTTDYAGLFINRNRLAAAAVAISVPGLVLWKWRVIPILAIGLLSKAAMVGGLTALIASTLQRRWWRTGAFICAMAALSATGYLHYLGVDKLGKTGWEHQRVYDRASLFINTAANITVTGQGLGSFWAGFPTFANDVVKSPGSVYTFDKRARTAHNDVLTLAYETGLIGLALFASLIVIIMRRPKRCLEDWAAWSGVVVILGMGMVSFPLYTPFAALMFGIHAGFLCRER